MGKFDCLVTFLGILVTEAECVALRAEFADLPKSWFRKLRQQFPVSSLDHMVWIPELAASLGGLSSSFSDADYQRGYIRLRDVDEMRTNHSSKTPYVLNETCTTHFDNFSRFLAARSEDASKPLRRPLKYVVSGVFNSYGEPPALLCALPIREDEKEEAVPVAMPATTVV
jgi:hypothetical protein